MHSEQIQAQVVAAMEDGKAEDIRVLDVRGMTDITDFMIVASGTSDRHVKAVADRVTEALKAQGCRPIGVEGEEEGDWILLDYGDVVAHVMRRATREFYDLERLWSEDLRDLIIAQREGRQDSS